jgi:hypothetical protein
VGMMRIGAGIHRLWCRLPTFEGTHPMQALIAGREITGFSA